MFNQSNPNSNKSKLERKEEKIYTEREYNPVDKRGALHEHPYDVQEDWVTITPPQNGAYKESTRVKTFSRLSIIIFLISIFVFLGAGSYAGYKIYFGDAGVDANKIVLQFADSPTYADGGEEFTADVVIGNQNKIPIGPVDLVIEYPKGSSYEIDSEVYKERINVGNIEPGGIQRITQKITLFGKEGDERKIKAHIDYNIPGSTAIFKKDIDWAVTLKSSPVLLSIDTLKETSSNQTFTLTANVEAVRGKDLEDFVVHIEYPTGFQFVSAEPTPRFENNTWIFSKLQKGDSKKIAITGIMKGELGDERVFRISGGQPKTNDPTTIGVVYAENKQSLSVAKPFIALSGTIEGKYIEDSTYAIENRDRVSVTINYKNNLTEVLNNVVLTAKLSGEVLDKKSVRVIGGYYDSSTDTVVWNRSTLQSLAELDPNRGGHVTLSFATLPLGEKKLGVYRQPNVSVSLSAQASRFTDNRVPIQVIGNTPLVAKVITGASLATIALKTTGPIQNEGPIPPRVEQDTTYTIMLSLKNNSTSVDGGLVSFILPPYVTFTGIHSPEYENVTYDNSSRQISWQVGTLNAEVGYNNKSDRRVYVQVSARPSITQLGGSLILANNIAFTGTDTYTKQPINVHMTPLNNKTVTESSYHYLDEAVIQ